MEQRKEQKKEQRVYAAFGRGARRDWKRAARKTVFSHYWMAIMVCLVAAFLGTEFTGSLESLHFTRQKWDVISNFLASFGRPGAAANSRGVFAIAVNKIADGSLQDHTWRQILHIQHIAAQDRPWHLLPRISSRLF